MRRTYINIAAFFVLTSALIAWSVTNYLPLGLLEDPRTVTVEFAESPGLRSGYEVTYLGHSVGRIEAVRLAEGVSEVELAIDDDADLPKDVVAAARRRSAIGEPYVDLSPAPGSDADTGPRLADGDRITADLTSSPIEYGELFRSLDELVESLDADAVATVVHELAVALDGRGDDIRAIVDGAHDLATTTAANGDELESLITDLGTVAAVLAAHRQALGSSIEGLADLADALKAATPALEAVAAETPPALAMVNRILAASDDALVCTIDGLSVLSVILDDEGQEAAATLLRRSADFAEVTTLVRDPDDGIFRLLISVNTGEPAVVQYDEPTPLPTVSATPACPDHDVVVTAAPEADAVGSGGGGSRPAADADATGAPSGRGDDRSAGLAGGSGVEADDPALVRIARRAAPWLAAALIAGLVWAVIARRRGAGS